jgi:hypothetical protein
VTPEGWEPTHNARLNSAAWNEKSLLEKRIDMTDEEYEQFHAEQRARVRARYGLNEPRA